MKIRSLALAAAGACLGLTAGAKASVVYTYVAVPNSITSTGSTTLSLYLKEVTSGGSYDAATTATAGPNNTGLYGVGVALVEQAGGTGVTVSSPTANSAAEPTGLSGNDATGLATNGGAYIENIENNNATTGLGASTSTVAGVTTNLYLIGTVNLTVASNANATFNVESIHDAPAGDNILHAGTDGGTLSVDGYDLDAGDPAITNGTFADGNPTTLVVNTESMVPEPASVSLIGAAAVFGLARRRRIAK
jgi:hypothetical protein